MFKRDKGNGSKKPNWFKGKWLNLVTVLSALVGVLGFVFTVFIYVHDLRPILNEEQLNWQNRELFSRNEVLLTNIEKNEKELSSLAKQIEVSNERIDSSEAEVARTKQELVQANKKAYLLNISGRIEMEYLSAVRNQEDASAIDIKQRALDLLKETDVRDEYEKAGLSEAVRFVEKHITPDSMYSAIRHYENTEEIALLQEKMNAIEKQTN